MPCCSNCCFYSKAQGCMKSGPCIYEPESDDDDDPEDPYGFHYEGEA